MGGSSSKEMSANHVVAAQAVPRATLIFLHGLGDTGAGWAEAFKQLRLTNIKCICPTAPVAPVTLNQGFRMNSWFDIYGLSADSKQDEAGVKRAAAQLNELITKEIAEMNYPSSESVILGGFSQGGAVALYAALTSPRKLAGILGLSTFLPLHNNFPKDFRQENSNIPVFQGHGKQDPVVPFEWGALTAKLLQDMSKNHTLKAYPMMQHSSCEEEMIDVKNFLETLVPVVKE